MSPFGKFLFCLTLLAASRLSSTLFAEAPPAPGVDSASRNASCLALARETGIRSEGGTGRNFVISPLSIHAALAMVTAGARGDTRRELLGFLGSASLDELHRAPAIKLVGRLNGLKQTSFACGVWVDQRLALRPEFTVTAASRYGAMPFHIPGGTTGRVPSMTTSRSQRIAVYPGFRALKLPYKNDVQQQAEFYMLILLPDSETEIADLYDKAVSTPEFIKTHSPTGKVPVGRFMVPKFKFTSKFELSSDMRKLGVTRAFEGGDFSGMMTGGEGLSINGVYHKATIEVDEQGTVAAAATAIVMEGSALPSEPPHFVDFVADRPFLFAVVEERTSTVLFLGHVVNPQLG